jgi:hypothetical protein
MLSAMSGFTILRRCAHCNHRAGQSGQPQAQVLPLPARNTDAPDGKPIGCKNNNYS